MKNLGPVQLVAVAYNLVQVFPWASDILQDLHGDYDLFHILPEFLSWAYVFPKVITGAYVFPGFKWYLRPSQITIGV